MKEMDVMDVDGVMLRLVVSWRAPVGDDAQ